MIRKINHRPFSNYIFTLTDNTFRTIVLIRRHIIINWPTVNTVATINNFFNFNDVSVVVSPEAILKSKMPTSKIFSYYTHPFPTVKAISNQQQKNKNATQPIRPSLFIFLHSFRPSLRHNTYNGLLKGQYGLVYYIGYKHHFRYRLLTPTSRAAPPFHFFTIIINDKKERVNYL